MDFTGIDHGDNNKEENPCAEVEIGVKFEHTNEVEFGDGNKDGEDPCAEFENEDIESDDIDFYVDNDNILDDVEVDMNDFNDNIDIDAEWVEGMNDNVVQEENEVGELNEVLNNEVLLSGSSSDEGQAGQRKKTIKAIQRAHDNDEANVVEPFYILQTFNTTQEFKERDKLHAIETRRELGFEKMTRLGGEGQQEVNNEDEEKCSWSLHASKWKRDVNWMVKSYNKEHRCLQTRNVKACTYKFLAKNIATQVEFNPTIPIFALQEQLQHDYQVGISKMKVFRARNEALNQDDLGLGTNSNFTFMIARQKGVLPAIAKLFPCVEHRYCLRHIHENMKANWRAKQFKDLLWDCAKASIVQQFQQSMEELRKLNNDVYEWLKPQHWSRSHFTCRAHTNAMLNNMCESLNSKIVEGRDVRIITCLEYIREDLIKKIVTVQKEIDKVVGPLNPTNTIWVEKLKKEATQLRSVFYGNRKYQVGTNRDTMCTCNSNYVGDIEEQRN
ncbi:unnamed protein product [Lactuca saligna]|uniref:Uncharacterized protein n=1 Tax=Lactuca saligna TaxID=75948 RepID=A0AA35ZJI0_LACSI|nr:unnamed protein product [Lactuca saligna]